MKLIAISSNTSWYLYNFRKNTILRLLDEGYEVLAIAPYDKYSEKLKDLGCSFNHIKIDSGGMSPIKDFITIINYYKIFKSTNPCLTLHFTPKVNIYGNLSAHFLKIKTINNIAGLGKLFVKDGLVTKFVSLLYKVSLRKSNHVFFQNEDDKSLFLDKNLVGTNNISRIPGSGVDLKTFKPQKPEIGKKIKFLLMARLLQEKGVRYYAEVAKEISKTHHKKVEFRLLGSIEKNKQSAISKKEIDSWVNDGYINFLGFTDDVKKEIALVDCVVLPSYYREGVPKSLLEAGAMGKPIITTNHTGCKETVDHNITGYLCKVKSSKSLLKYVLKFLSLTKDQRDTMGENSYKKIVSEFDENIIISKYMNKVKKLC